MGYLIEFALGIGGNLIAAEIIFHHKRWCQRIIRSAAKRISDPDQSKIKLEEWLAALDEHVGLFASLSHAVGCWIGAPEVAAALKQPVPKTAADNRTEHVPRFDGGMAENQSDLSALLKKEWEDQADKVFNIVARLIRGSEVAQTLIRPRLKITFLWGGMLGGALTTFLAWIIIRLI